MAETHSVAYTGKRTKTGNSSAFRIEQSFFKSHPEFSGEITVQPIAPGRLLIIASPAKKREFESDPILDSFLAFLGKDMNNRPEKIKPLDADLEKRIKRLTKGVKVSRDEDLGDEAIPSMVRNGWKLYSYALFADQLNFLVEKVEKLRVQSSETCHSEPATKLLTTISDLICKQIPSNPEAPQFRQGNTREREQALVSRNIPSAVSTVLSLLHKAQSDCVRLAQRRRHIA
jgi:prlF antitoxin for toxin YhaV_toxin